jgi:hypothetical protein
MTVNQQQPICLFSRWRYTGSQPGVGEIHIVGDIDLHEDSGFDVEITTVSPRRAWLGYATDFCREFTWISDP